VSKVATIQSEVLGTCLHCASHVTVASIPSCEAFLAFEATGLCGACQELLATVE